MATRKKNEAAVDALHARNAQLALEKKWRGSLDAYSTALKESSILLGAQAGSESFMAALDRRHMLLKELSEVGGLQPAIDAINMEIANMERRAVAVPLHVQLQPEVTILDEIRNDLTDEAQAYVLRLAKEAAEVRNLRAKVRLLEERAKDRQHMIMTPFGWRPC